MAGSGRGLSTVSYDSPGAATLDDVRVPYLQNRQIMQPVGTLPTLLCTGTSPDACTRRLAEGDDADHFSSKMLKASLRDA